MKKILFFTPSCRLTGSEIALYNLISNIDRNSFKPVGVISLLEGSLLSKFDREIFTISYEKHYQGILPLIELLKVKVLKQRKYQHFFIKLHNKLKPDIWYINTIVQPEVLYAAQLLNIPCIVHSHELEQMLTSLTSDYVQLLVSYPKLIISCSNVAKTMLTTLGRRQNIEVCHPSLNTSLIDQYIDINLKTKYRATYALPKDAFIWLMSGINDVNKNPIRFIELAKEIITLYPNTYFLWIGADLESAIHIYLIQYCKQLGILEKIRWVSNLDQEKYYKYFASVDAFILTSNRESFSLVLLEAMYLGKPVISLNCGGTKEIITNNTGIIIDSWNNDDIIKEMIKVMNKEFSYSEIAANNQAKIFSIDHQSNLWNNILIDYFG